MKKHFQVQHRWAEKDGVRWVPAKVQTLFRGNLWRFFEVESENEVELVQQQPPSAQVDTLI